MITPDETTITENIKVMWEILHKLEKLHNQEATTIIQLSHINAKLKGLNQELEDTIWHANNEYEKFQKEAETYTKNG